MTDYAEQLRQQYGHWGNHPDFSITDWQREVSERNTRLGYWEWVASLMEQETADRVAAFHSVTSEDIDRLLKWGDTFLDKWAEDAVESGQIDLEYETQMQEWRQLRPLLTASPTLLRALGEIAVIVSHSGHGEARRYGVIAKIALAAIRSEK